ncbi:TetR family transcriptional regulator [Mycobacteroides immunogenum]|uniref:TetR family transcriptional regulator n=1 Tax=Mycobacteroides immunogenum TaxID=83262 RepID=UPI0025B784BA|nr:TetR family transcriptional regulator [Mycobacteroides immunogenum]WJR32686.1 TetR family transcriptional regulator [Mycobacteroides immunogenum]
MAGRRDEILETFIRHVAERGYDQTNLGDIAGELGMSKGTIVHHFGTKAQLLRELEETYMTNHLEAVRVMWEQLPSPAERIAAIIYASTMLQVTARAATVASQREVVKLSDDPAMQEVRKIRGEMQALIAEEIRKGTKNKTFRKIDANLATLQLMGSLQWMWVWFSPDGLQTPEEIGAGFVDIFLGGLLVDRYGLPTLADPKGHVVDVVRKALASAAGGQE